MEPLGAGERAEGPKARRCECTLFCFQFDLKPQLGLLYLSFILCRYHHVALYIESRVPLMSLPE